MAAIDWSQCQAVESIPGKVSGAWVFKGTRLPVATVIENLEDLSRSPAWKAAPFAQTDESAEADDSDASANTLN